MMLLRSALLSTALLAACGGSAKPSTMPEPAAAPVADEAATPVEPAPAAEPTPALEAEAPVPAAAPPPPPKEEVAPARKTRAPVTKSPAKTADPCDGGE